MAPAVFKMPNIIHIIKFLFDLSIEGRIHFHGKKAQNKGGIYPVSSYSFQRSTSIRPSFAA